MINNHDDENTSKNAELASQNLDDLDNEISKIKAGHEMYFWLRERSKFLVCKLLFVAFIFGLIAWVMRKVSKNIENAETKLKSIEMRYNERNHMKGNKKVIPIIELEKSTDNSTQAQIGQNE